MKSESEIKLEHQLGFQIIVFLNNRKLLGEVYKKTTKFRSYTQKQIKPQPTNPETIAKAIEKYDT